MLDAFLDSILCLDTINTHSSSCSVCFTVPTTHEVNFSQCLDVKFTINDLNQSLKICLLKQRENQCK